MKRPTTGPVLLVVVVVVLTACSHETAAFLPAKSPSFAARRMTSRFSKLKMPWMKPDEDDDDKKKKKPVEPIFPAKSTESEGKPSSSSHETPSMQAELKDSSSAPPPAPVYPPPAVAVSPSANSTPSSEKPQKPKQSSTLFGAIDKFGLGLKPKALTASSKAQLSEKTRYKIWYMLQMTVLYTLFIVFRAYRGFFVLLPAVFSQTYAKLETAVDKPFLMDLDDQSKDTNAARWSTRITVSVLAFIVTLTYVLGGAARVTSQFVKSIVKTSSLTQSFEAAATEQETNEAKLRAHFTNQAINGQEQDKRGASDDTPPPTTSRLAP